MELRKGDRMFGSTPISETGFRTVVDTLIKDSHIPEGVWVDSLLGYIVWTSTTSESPGQCIQELKQVLKDHGYKGE